MKTSSRKRLLVSSVAMLLVAMLALGTATFAWFTQTTEATADGIYVKSVKASSLLISNSTSGWVTSFSYGVGGSSSPSTMLPASSANGNAWYSAVSEDKDTGAFSTISNVSVPNLKYVFQEQLNVQNGGNEGTINNVKITFDLSSISNDYIRVALVEANNSNVTTGTFSSSVYAQTVKTYSPLTSISGTTAGTTITTIGPDTDNGSDATKLEVSVGNLAAGAEKHYNLFIWFEGQDSNCIDDNVGQTISNLTFTVTGTPA